MVFTRSKREIDKIARSCQIVADTLIFIEPQIKAGTGTARYKGRGAQKYRMCVIPNCGGSSTCSRRDGYEQVSDWSTKDQVLEVLAELGYEPG